MANIVEVWDLEGNRHEVSPANAADLVAHLRWSRRAPIFLPQEPVEVPPPAKASKVAKQAPAPTPAAAEPVNLAALSREGLVRFAQENFGMQFDANVSAEAIINAILAEQGK